MVNDHDPGRSGRPLAAPPRSTREGDRPRRVRAPDAAAGHAVCQDLSQHRRARPHLSIDVSAAKAVPGVHRVITAEDVLKVIPEPYYGPAFHDQPVLAIGKVHYIGEPVAVVLARDPHVAEEAASMIVADYEELPAVFDEVEAADNKILVHEELKPAGTFADLKHLKGRRGTNIALDFRLRRGDTDKAFAGAAHVFEHTFRTQKVLHLALEPYCSIGDWKESGVTIYSGAQGPSFVRTEIARLLGLPENRVRIKVPYLGGGFGGKLYIKMEALAVALSMIVRRPVKVALTMEEQFFTITKHPSTFRIKSGVDKDGRITARKCEVFWNGGAYADIGPRVTQKSGFTASGPLRHRQRVDRFLRALHQPAAGRRAARLRRPATGLGLREPHRPDRPGAQDRSARIPPQERPAAGPAAGHRHHHQRRRRRAIARARRRAHELEPAVRPRQRQHPPRARPCDRP